MWPGFGGLTLRVKEGGSGPENGGIHYYYNRQQPSDPAGARYSTSDVLTVDIIKRGSHVSGATSIFVADRYLCRSIWNAAYAHVVLILCLCPAAAKLLPVCPKMHNRASKI